jgi:hypothetical protein
LGFMAKTAKYIAKLIKPKQEEIFSRDIEQNE